MPASPIELKNSLPDLDLNPGRREPSAGQASRHCGLISGFNHWATKDRLTGSEHAQQNARIRGCSRLRLEDALLSLVFVSLFTWENCTYTWEKVKKHTPYMIFFLRCFDTVGWVIWPVKPVSNMTYNVFGWTLSLTQPIITWYILPVGDIMILTY